MAKYKSYNYSQQVLIPVSLEDQIMRADKLTLQYLANASYDPQGLIDFLYKIIYTDSNKRRFLIHYLTSHPISMERMNSLVVCFTQLNIQDKSFDTRRERFIEMTRPVHELYGLTA